MLINIHDDFLGWSDDIGGLLLLVFDCCCWDFLSEDGDVDRTLTFCCFGDEIIDNLGEFSWDWVNNASFEIDERPALLLLLPVLRPCDCSLSSLDGIYIWLRWW